MNVIKNSSGSKHSIFRALVANLEDSLLAGTTVIPWASPVPYFGDPSTSVAATLGINPSRREFQDGSGEELGEDSRRLHTLRSLGLSSWREAKDEQLRCIHEGCARYFRGRPYDLWFGRLEPILNRVDSSYYGGLSGACHLDLVPYATDRVWGQLNQQQRSRLLDVSGNALGLVLRDSPVNVLILNGRSVVRDFERTSRVRLGRRTMPTWSIQRGKVKGIAFRGQVDSVAGISLGRRLLVLGFNHNIQSSFGVTSEVVSEVCDWVAGVYRKFSQGSSSSVRYPAMLWRLR